MIFDGESYHFYGVDVDAMILEALCTERDFVAGADDRQLLGHMSDRVHMLSMPVVWESLARLRKFGVIVQTREGLATATQLGVATYEEHWPSSAQQ